MKNLLKKTFSLLIALTILLSGISAIADDGDEANEATVLTLEVGKGISGTLQPDSATEIRAYAGRSGEVRFTLTLTDDCGPAITVNGSSISLARQNDSLPVYTFTLPFAGGESKTISLTANAAAGFSMISEPISEKPEPKAEESAPVPEPATEPENEPTTEPEKEDTTEPAKEAGEESEDKTSAPEEVNEPKSENSATTDTGHTEDSEAEPAEGTESETTEDPTNLEEKTEPEPQEPAATEEEPEEGKTTEEPKEDEPKEESTEPTEEIKSETDSGEPEQPAEPENIPDAEETEGQQTEEQESEQPTTEEQVPEQTTTEEQEAEQATTEDNKSAQSTTEEQESEQTTTEGQEPEHPTTEEQEPEQPKTENTEGSADSVEIIIAKSLTPDESWKGTVRKSRPTILKLDVADSRMIHLFVEGKDVLYSVQKSDRITEDAGYVLTDTETNHSVTSWAAEPGSYLISIRAGENSMGARVTISFKNDEEFAAWEEEQAALKAESQEEEKEDIPEESGKDSISEETGEKPEKAEIDPKTEEGVLPERSVSMVIEWDTDDPILGDTAHMKAILEGYDDLSYSLQWQNSHDCETWKDIAGATGETFDIMITEENNDLYWRVLVYLEADADGEEE